MSLQTSRFVNFMISPGGRLFRVAVGLFLVAVGFLMYSIAGIVVAAVGLLPLASGVFDFCLISKVKRAPL